MAIRHAILTLAAITVCLSTATINPVHASTESPPASLDSDPAALQLAQDFHLTYAEAYARVSRQQADGALATLLEQRHPTTFAGTWIDQASDGLLHVRFTQAPADFEQLVASTGLAGKTVLGPPARFSWSQLTTVHQRLAANPALMKAISASVDPQDNRVNIGVPSAALPASLTRTLTSIVGSLPGGSHLFTDPALPHRGSKLGCGTNDTGEQVCSFPLRGGTRIRDSLTGEGCSTGVNAYSRTDGKRYMITAGHCFESADVVEQTVWNNIEPEDFVEAIGVYHRKSYTGSGTQDWGDIAIYSNVTREAAIDVEASTGTRPTVANPDYPIHGSGVTTVGAYYCKSGATNGTGCGQVTGVAQTNAGISGLGEINLIHSSNRVCSGDSGGPIFAAGIVYGILVSGWQPDGFAPNGAACNDYVDYVGITAVLNDLNLYLNVQ
jgi:streptogrisin C